MVFSRFGRGVAVALFLLFVGIILYRSFVFGDNTLLYKDIGRDSLDIFYPYLVHVSDYVRHTGYPSWSFYVGMGQSLSLFAGYLISQPIVWLPRELIPNALVFQHLLKITVVGALFFQFLQLRRLTFRASLVGSFLLSFSAYMCMGSCWYGLADEVVAYTFVLFAVEKALRTGRWLYLPLAVAFTALLTFFQLYLAALLLSLYVPARLLVSHGWKPAKSARIIAQLAGVSILGVGVAAVIFLDAADSMIHSPRGSGPVSLAHALFSEPFWKTAPRLQNITALLRPFANDIMGSGSNFRGWKNYLEAPMNYCGMLCLVLLPQAFVSATRRQRILYSLVLTFAFVPTIFPWFRHLFWLFQGDYYRTYTLFSVLGILTVSMGALSRYTEKRMLHLAVLVLTAVVSLTIVFCPPLQSYIEPKLRNIVALFVLIYVGILAGGHILNRQGLATWLIVMVAVIEVVYLDDFTIANRTIMTKSELNQRRYYNDYTVDAVRDIKNHDSSFFRITKTWASVPLRSSDPNDATAFHSSMNDSMVFGYYGTPSYSSVNNLNYITFLLAVEAIPSSSIEVLTRWAKGCQDSPLLQTFAGEKYVLTKNPVPFQSLSGFHYEVVGRYQDISVLRNNLALPFGLAYTDYISERLFRGLPSAMKTVSLLCAVVLSDADVENGYNLTNLDKSGLDEAVTSPHTLNDRFAMSLQMSSFEQTQFEGTIAVSKRAILVFQTPFDAGWHAFRDEKPVPVLRVDAGLLGVLLDPGDHRVRLHFIPRLLHLGAALSLLSLAVYWLLLRYWPVLRIGD
jgi:uncharacterized membrane protein YfhO